MPKRRCRAVPFELRPSIRSRSSRASVLYLIGEEVAPHLRVGHVRTRLGCRTAGRFQVGRILGCLQVPEHVHRHDRRHSSPVASQDDPFLVVLRPVHELAKLVAGLGYTDLRHGPYTTRPVQVVEWSELRIGYPRWTEVRFSGLPDREPWVGVDWDADPDWEFHTAWDLEPDELKRRYRQAYDRSRNVVATATGLDQLSVRPLRDGRHFSLRWMLLHLIEETARRAGHADFLREAIDGTVGD